MPNPRHLGSISLGVVAGGCVTIDVLIAGGLLSGGFWRVVATGFEAGTVGALADWYAVTALFHSIPLPLLSHHSNILVKNRKRITENIAEMVQARLLTPESVREGLKEYPPSQFLLDLLEEPERRRQLLDFARVLLEGVAKELDRTEAAEFLEMIFKDQLKDLALAQPLGRWVEGAIRRGEHEPIWEAFLCTLQEHITGNGQNALRVKIMETLRNAAQDYKDKGWLKRVSVNLLEWLKALDYGPAADSLLSAMNALIQEMRDNPRHPVRQEMNDFMLTFARKLSQGDPETTEAIERFKRSLVENANLRELVTSVLVRFKGTVLEQLSKDDSPLVLVLERMLGSFLDDLRSNAKDRPKLDSLVSNVIANVLEKKPDFVRAIVLKSLSPEKLSDDALVGEVEGKIGGDLQYVRLNGAVVGGIVGLILGTAKFLAGW